MRGIERRRRVVERGHADVRGHDRLRRRRRSRRGTARARPRRRRRASAARDASPASVEPWPGKVLRARGDAAALRARARRRRRAARRAAASEPNARVADHRVRRHVHVGDRREVPVDADRGELRGDRRRDALRQRRVVEHAERSAARDTSCRCRHSSRVTSPPSSSIASSTSSRSARRRRTARRARSRDGTL